MEVKQWARLLSSSLIPLGVAALVIATLVGDPLAIILGVMAVIFGVLASVYVRIVPDERFRSVEPTLGTAVVRITGMTCLFTCIAYVMISLGTVEATAIATRPSIPFATVSVVLGATVGVGFPFVIDRVAHPRIVHSLENLLVIALFAGFLAVEPESGVPYAGAFLLGRSGVYVDSLA